VKSQDLFGITVQLTYKGQRSFSTACGGCLSILIVVGFTVGFILQFYKLYSQPEWLSTPETYTFGNMNIDVPQNQATVAISLDAKFATELDPTF